MDRVLRMNIQGACLCIMNLESTHTSGETKHVVALAPFCDSFPCLHNCSGKLDAHDLGGSGCHWVVALALHKIHAIESKRLDLKIGEDKHPGLLEK